MTAHFSFNKVLWKLPNFQAQISPWRSRFLFSVCLVGGKQRGGWGWGDSSQKMNSSSSLILTRVQIQLSDKKSQRFYSGQVVLTAPSRLNAYTVTKGISKGHRRKRPQILAGYLFSPCPLRFSLLLLCSFVNRFLVLVGSELMPDQKISLAVLRSWIGPAVQSEVRKLQGNSSYRKNITCPCSNIQFHLILMTFLIPCLALWWKKKLWMCPRLHPLSLLRTIEKHSYFIIQFCFELKQTDGNQCFKQIN